MIRASILEKYGFQASWGRIENGKLILVQDGDHRGIFEKEVDIPAYVIQMMQEEEKILQEKEKTKNIHKKDIFKETCPYCGQALFDCGGSCVE